MDRSLWANCFRGILRAGFGGQGFHYAGPIIFCRNAIPHLVHHFKKSLPISPEAVKVETFKPGLLNREGVSRCCGSNCKGRA
jgi:hypothetical protein